MSLRLLTFTVLAFALQAEDGSKVSPPTEHELLMEAKAQIAQRDRDNAAKDQQIAKLTRKVQIYQQAAFGCQDAQIDAQIEAQAKQQGVPRVGANGAGSRDQIEQAPRPAPAKPQGEQK